MTALQVEPLQAALGARVHGLRLDRVPDAAVREAIEAALERHGVLVFPDQTLSPADQVAFSRAFADLLEPNNSKAKVPGFPEVFAIGNQGSELVTFSPLDPNGLLEWHADHMHVQRPARASLLYALQVPPTGGETHFSCMYAAFDALSEADKALARSLRAVHSVSGLNRFLDEHSVARASKDDFGGRAAPTVSWPLVRHHPRSGRESLYFGSHVTIGIEGWDESRALAFIDGLTELANRPEHRYSHCWQAGDAVLWDNRRVLHAGGAYDVHNHPREMHRTTWAEDRPIC
ncbi:MAG: TauD/TfdA family dioxygenase [Gammaproteobacteria bacterium]|nr:TauD/TfdA family dioxygenase [Gammaproteobacteria bacterium]